MLSFSVVPNCQQLTITVTPKKLWLHSHSIPVHNPLACTESEECGLYGMHLTHVFVTKKNQSSHYFTY